MKILYIFPHPDDESFGPGSAIAKQVREGHEVYLLTLTRGEATKVRFELGYSKEEMGEVRFAEMQEVSRAYGLTRLDVLRLPDSELKELDPRVIEKSVSDYLLEIEPHVVVSYPVHGISGFHDHLVTHAVVKRVFLEQKRRQPQLQRLAFHTLSKEQAGKSKHFSLSYSASDEIDCVITVDDSDLRATHAALDCYKTYQKTIEHSGIRELLDSQVCFELFQESFDPPLKDIFAELLGGKL